MSTDEIIERLLDEFSEPYNRSVIKLRLENLAVTAVQEFLGEPIENKNETLKDLFQGFAEDLKK